MVITPSASPSAWRSGIGLACWVGSPPRSGATRAIASCVDRDELGPEDSIPSVFNKRVAVAVAREVALAAHKAGAARRPARMDSAMWR